MTDLRIVLLGKTGVGKSSSGNTLLGRKAFLSKRSFRSVTSDCAEENGCVFGINISVVDTPGMFSTSSSDETVDKKCIGAMESRVPCIFLIVIKVDRFTDEERVAVEKIEDILGEDRKQRSYILLTHGDGMDGMTAEEIISEEGAEKLMEIVKRFEGRCHLFNNRTDEPAQVKDLLTKLNSLHQNCEAAQRETSINPDEERRSTTVAIVGRHGVGKSATGNTIFGLKGTDKFESNCAFGPVTTHSVAKTASVHGRQVTVMDTPGLTEFGDPQNVIEEWGKCLLLSQGVLHAFVLVFQMGGLTQKDKEVVDCLTKTFGVEILNHIVVVFTHGDKVDSERVEVIINEDEHAKDLIDTCGGRYCIFNNKVRHSDQVRNMLTVVDEMVERYESGLSRIALTIMREERARDQDWLPSAWQRFKAYLMNTFCCCIRPKYKPF